MYIYKHIHICMCTVRSEIVRHKISTHVRAHAHTQFVVSFVCLTISPCDPIWSQTLSHPASTVFRVLQHKMPYLTCYVFVQIINNLKRKLNKILMSKFNQGSERLVY